MARVEAEAHRPEAKNGTVDEGARTSMQSGACRVQELGPA